MSEAECCVGSNGATLSDDLIDALEGDTNSSGKLNLSHAQGLEEVEVKNGAGMCRRPFYGKALHGSSRNQW
jgi:hypothetical protein